MDQRKEENKPIKQKSSTQAKDRMGKLIAFEKRDRFLKSKNGRYIVALSQKSITGEEEKPYWGYVFQNTRTYGGYFVLLETAEEDELTKIAYIDQQKINGENTKRKKNEKAYWSKIARKYMYAPEEDFENMENTVKIGHDNLDEYKEKVEELISQNEENERTIAEVFKEIATVPEVENLALPVLIQTNIFQRFVNKILRRD